MSVSPIDHLAELFDGEGARSYLGEDVSLATHMLQAAALAEAERASNHLVIAALLHDIGHFAAFNRREVDSRNVERVDFHHEESGADWLAQWFPAEVSEAVRLHVTAKRYLCHVDLAYLTRLSPASVRTLALQGGPLTAAEAQAFEALPHAQAAVRVRRWDDAAKDPAAKTPAFARYRPLLAASCQPAPGKRSMSAATD